MPLKMIIQQASMWHDTMEERNQNRKFLYNVAVKATSQYHVCFSVYEMYLKPSSLVSSRTFGEVQDNNV
jgi:hypothetical protein